MRTVNPTFNNRENEVAKTTDGRTIWLSRSVAVVFHLVVQSCGTLHVLMGKRGCACDAGGRPDQNGKWGLTCGYLDWDESSYEACLREVWEECKIDVQALIDSYPYDIAHQLYDAGQQPWIVVSTPGSDKLQNVSLHHGVVIFAGEDSLDEGLFVPQDKLSEISEIRWFPVNDLPPSEQVAFNHDKRIGQFVHLLLDEEAKIRDYAKAIVESQDNNKIGRDLDE